VSIRYADCWAKTTPSDQPGISVEQHCRTAGIVARLLAERWPEWVRSGLLAHNGVVLAALHDIGKVAPGFQKKCPAWMSAHRLKFSEFVGLEEDHAKVGQATVQRLLGEDDLRYWSAVVGAHHGRLKGDSIGRLCDGGAEWTEQRRFLAQVLIAEFGPLPKARTTGADDVALWFNAGLVAVADWLASDEQTFPSAESFDTAVIRTRAREQLDRIGFRPLDCARGKAFTELFPFSPNSLQQVLLKAVRCPGVYVVEATMGCGKTEAALMAAYNLLANGQATGIYFALPTQTTSNRIHERVAAFVEKIASGCGTRLTHGSSWLRDVSQPLTGRQDGILAQGEGLHDGRDWFASSRRALLAPFGVGTVDQALLGVIAAKHFFVRQYGLAGKVVILDEVHSYDLYTGTLLDLLVKRLRELGATVIVLSATLTAGRRRELLGLPNVERVAAEETAYPLISVRMDKGTMEYRSVQADPSRTVRVQFKRGAELADACLEHASRGECVLWIRNTVSDAQETFLRLCGTRRDGGPEIGLLHSRFPQYRREQLESDWLTRLGKESSTRPTDGCVLVATQVAEQSVDIDADLLVTDLAPTDMLLQRLGRLWRHERQRPSGCGQEVWIATPGMDVAGLRSANLADIKKAFGKSAKVYVPYVLLRTLEQWSERKQVVLPDDIRVLLEETYAEPGNEEPAAWQKLREELESQRRKLRNAALAEANLWQLPLEDKEGIHTRWNSCPTMTVVPVSKAASKNFSRGASLELLNGERCEVMTGVFRHAAAQTIHRNLVKVPRWCLRDAAGRTPSWLREYVNDDVLPCKLADGKLLFLPDGVESGLTYRDDLGVVVPAWKGRSQVAGYGDGEGEDESYDW
jgi:CRISPR-associated endonuclease/helicase Cas3